MPNRLLCLPPQFWVVPNRAPNISLEVITGSKPMRYPQYIIDYLHSTDWFEKVYFKQIAQLIYCLHLLVIVKKTVFEIFQKEKLYVHIQNFRVTVSLFLYVYFLRYFWRDNENVTWNLISQAFQNYTNENLKIFIYYIIRSSNRARNIATLYFSIS